MLQCCNVQCLPLQKYFEELDEDTNYVIAPQEEDAGDIDNDDNSEDEVLHEPHDSDDDSTEDGDYLFSNDKRKENNHTDDTEDYLGMCNPPDLQNSFEIGVVNDEGEKISHYKCC